MRLVSKRVNEVANVEYFNRTVIIIEPSTNINELNLDLSKCPIKALCLNDMDFDSFPNVYILLDNFEFNSLCILYERSSVDTSAILKIVNKMEYLKVLTTKYVFYNLIEVIINNIEKLEKVYFNYGASFFQPEDQVEMESIAYESNTIHCVPLDQHSNLKHLFIDCEDYSNHFFNNYNTIKFFKIIAKSLKHLTFHEINANFANEWFRSANFNLETMELKEIVNDHKHFDYIFGRKVFIDGTLCQSNLYKSLTSFTFSEKGLKWTENLVNLQLDLTKMSKLKVRF